MKPLAQIDFLAPAPRPWSGIALLTLSLTLLGTSGATVWQIEQDNRAGNARVSQLTARLAPPAPRKLSEAERVRLAQAERVAGELRAPWAELLATFEEHGRADVGLLKLEPDARAGLVRVTGQARNVKALFDYLLALEADARLVDVALTQHQAERDVPGQPLRFTIQAGWRTTPPARVRANS